MRCIVVILTLLMCPAAAVAQDWRLNTFDDGSYFMGGIYQSPGFALSCGERSPQGRSAMETGNMEPTITRPGLFRMSLSDEELAFPDGVVRPRDDVMIVVGTLGFSLPGVRFDELFNEWWVDLPVGDPLFPAIASVESFEIRSRDGITQVDARRFGEGLNALSAYCQRMFAAIGQPWQAAPQPNAPAQQTPQQGAASMRALAEAAITRGCNGAAVKAPDYLLSGEIDGDGREDVVLDWRGVECQAGMPRPFCGASMCSADVFLSSRSGVSGGEANLLALGVSLVPLSNGNMGVKVGQSSGSCGAAACEKVFFWNGAELVPLP